MTDPLENPAGAAPERGPRKPYRRPEIVSREPLEAIASTCTGGGAKTNPPNTPCNITAKS